MDPTALIAITSALLGGLLPLVRELLKQLIKANIGDKFFRENPIGKQIAKQLKLDSSLAGPEAMFKELSAASQKMDEVVKQIQEYTRGREQAVERLESQLGLLSQQESELKERIHGLQNVPLPAAEYFAQLVTKGEKKNAFRDYMLFLLGVVVTSGVEIALRKLGWL